jgi:hypothetical protein
MFEAIVETKKVKVLKFKLDTFLKRGRVESRLRDFLALGLLGKNKLLAGGSLLNLFSNTHSTINDFDIFCSNYEYSQLDYILSDGTILSKNDMTTTYQYKNMKIQLIDKFAENADYVFSTFDFHCCCVATDGEYVYATRDAIRDIRNTRIRINRPEYVTLKRVFSYASYKNFVVPKETREQLIKMIKTDKLGKATYDVV